MMVITVQLNGLTQFQNVLARAGAQIEQKAQQAINRTLQRARTQMTNAVGEKLNLKKKTIRELISIQRANKIMGLMGKLTVKNKTVPLMEYNAKQNRKGVSFKIFRDRPRQLIKHAFITPDSRGRDTVFKRETQARLKIKPLYGTRVGDVGRDKLIKVKTCAGEFFEAELKRLLTLKK